MERTTPSQKTLAKLQDALGYRNTAVYKAAWAAKAYVGGSIGQPELCTHVSNMASAELDLIEAERNYRAFDNHA
jgi:hypothetical protein